jgi:hypothetical protein
MNKMNNEIRIERMYGLENHAPKTKATVLVSCCGCGCEKHIDREEANEWEGTLFGVDAWMCRECE